jgi:hypothetical protein
MKKKLILILVGLGLIFSMGFLPAYTGEQSGGLNSPVLKPTNSAPVELTITNNTGGKADVYIFNTSQNYIMRLGSDQIGKIKVKPGKYMVWVTPEKCDAFGKNIKITKKAKLTFKCGKLK